MRTLHVDLETRSRTDLQKEGLYKYATDPSTDVICMSYAFDDEPVLDWRPGAPFPVAFAQHILDGGPLFAHHSPFERLMFECVIGPDYGAPDIDLEQWYCTAFMARCNNLPATLKNMARALDLPHQKSSRGLALIKMLSIPQADGTFYSTPELVDEMQDYCRGDVEAERAGFKRMRFPESQEWEDFFVCERLNDRGVKIDFDLAVGCQAYAEEEEAELIEVIEQVTGGEVTKARGEKLKAWVIERLTEEQQQVTVRHRKGKKVHSLDKYVRGMLLTDEHLEWDVREVLQASDFAQRSSVSKFKTMQAMADPIDGRVRGAFVANGASASGRYSSRGLQCHNFTRKSMPDPSETRLDIVEDIHPDDIRDYYEMPIMEILSKMLRPALIPEDGKQFMVSDWSAIEGRVAPWLADSDMGEAKLDLYRKGIDPYKTAAAEIYHVPYEEIGDESPERQIGKVAELALQFGGGAGAFLSMGRNFGVNVTETEANVIKDAWRRANPWAKILWGECEQSAIQATTFPGNFYPAGRMTYFSKENVLCGGNTLFCLLPCGRLLTYPDARVEMKETPWGELRPSLTSLRAAFTPKAGVREWPRTSLWGGLLTENCIAEGTKVLTDRGWQFIEHVTELDRVHDGDSFVTNGGLLFKGQQACVTVDGVHMTPDHEVLTDDGWKTAETSPEPYRREIWYVDGAEFRCIKREKTQLGFLMRLRSRVREIWRGSEKGCEERADPELRLRDKELSTETENPRHEQTPGVCGVPVDDRQVQAADAPGMEKLRRSRYPRLRSVAVRVRSFLGRHVPSLCSGAATGSHRQHERVLEEELPLGGVFSERTQQAYKRLREDQARLEDSIRNLRTERDKRHNVAVPDKTQLAGRVDAGEARPSQPKRVYDILNCGPNNRFMVLGASGPFIVHNCTQGAAASLLRDKLREADKKDVPVVMHVHDELVVESASQMDRHILHRIMNTAPTWAPGLPIKADVKLMEMFGK